MKKFGPTINGSFPPSMRRQLWPLCCGAAIISGFKDVTALEHDALVAQIKDTIDEHTPDFQVFNGETINPKLTFLTLNSTQMGSAKIMAAIGDAGFVKFGEGKPRGSSQGFFVRDASNTFTTCALADGKAAAA